MPGEENDDGRGSSRGKRGGSLRCTVWVVESVGSERRGEKGVGWGERAAEPQLDGTPERGLGRERGVDWRTVEGQANGGD